MRKRLTELARRLDLDSPNALAARVRSERESMYGLLADTLSTNHTTFFREPIVLERIPRDIMSSLPRRVDRHRIWSAASSTGEEAYSVAMLLAEHLGADRAQQEYAILGTDLVQRVVQQAERGRYSRAVVKGMSEDRKLKWFSKKGSDAFEVSAELKRMCTFRRLNLVNDNWPFNQKFSIILCRNVLYYFDKQTQTKILQGLYRVCEPGGWLLTSVSESLREIESKWVTLSTGIHRKGK